MGVARGRRAKVGRIYRISWLDHFDHAQDTAWGSIEEISPEVPEVQTVGFVVYDDDQLIGVAHSVEGGECSQPRMILKACIVDMREVRE